MNQMYMVFDNHELYLLIAAVEKALNQMDINKDFMYRDWRSCSHIYNTEKNRIMNGSFEANYNEVYLIRYDKHKFILK